MGLQGIYWPGSCMIHERCSFEEFNQAVEYFFETKSDGIYKIGISPKLPPSFLTDDDISFYANCFLTGIHERTHFLQHMSTPFGLFLARCSMTKAALLQSVFLDLRKSKWFSNGGNVYIPLHEWNKVVKAVDEQLSYPLNEKLKCIKNIEDLESVFFYKGHFNGKNDENNLTSTQKLVAQGFNNYFGLDPLVKLPRFKHKQIPYYDMIQDRRITSQKIIESYAKFIEMTYVNTLNLPDEVMKQSLLAPYDEKFYLVTLKCIEELYPEVDTSTMLAILDYSLFTIADPLFYELWDSEVYVEDFIPACRMFQIIETAKENKLNVENLDFLDFYEKMADLLKWPSPELIIKKMCGFNFQTTPVPADIEGEKYKRSQIEPLLFDQINKISQIRLNTSFVDDPHLQTINTDANIHPLLIMGDQNIQISNLTVDKSQALLKDLVRFELVDDLLNFDDYRNTNSLLKTIGAKVGKNPVEFYNRIFPDLYFVPFEKMKPISDLFI